MRGAFVVALTVAIAALSSGGAHASLPDSVWIADFGTGAQFGDPVTFCLAGPRSSQQCRFAVLVFNSSKLGTNASLVTMRAEDGSVVWHAALPNAGTAMIASYNGWVTVGRSRSGGNDTLFTATTTRLLAYDSMDGSLVWSVPTVYLVAPTSPPVPPVPAHPTYFEGCVYYTFENGVNSSALVAVNATDGSTLWNTATRAATLPWAAALPRLIVFVGQQEVNSEDVFLIALHAGTGNVAWFHGPLAWSAPGLWDNPNLDVDAEGAIVFMYAKPHIGLRQISAFDATNGARLWTVNDTDAQHITDYDTYADSGDFFRLMTVNASTMVLQRLKGTTGQLEWQAPVATTDANSILLVGNGLAFQFGLSSRMIQAYSAASGAAAWDASYMKGSPTTGALVSLSMTRFGRKVSATMLGFGLVPAGCFHGLIASQTVVV